MEITNKRSIAVNAINWFYLILLNFVLMFLFGFLTLDSNANWNSRLGAALLSIFIPCFITSKTKEMTGIERMLKFGHGFILYIGLALLIVGPKLAIITGLIPCLLVAVGLLYSGRNLDIGGK